MPIVDLGMEVFRDTIQYVRRRVGQVKLLLRVGRARHWDCVEAVGSRRNNIFGIDTPFSVDDFDCDQAGQALLLSTAVQCRELCADSDSWGRYGVLDGVSRAWNVSSDWLEIVLDSAIARLVCGMAVVSLVLAWLDWSGVMAVGMGEMTVVRVDAVAVLVRTREAGLGWRARAWVEDGSLYRVVAVVGLTLDRVVRVMRLALDRVVTMMRLALDGIVILMSMTLSRGIGLVSMARRIVPGSGIVVRVSCAIA
jgi:hypothetical protein